MWARSFAHCEYVNEFHRYLYIIIWCAYYLHDSWSVTKFSFEIERSNRKDLWYCANHHLLNRENNLYFEILFNIIQSTAHNSFAKMPSVLCQTVILMVLFVEFVYSKNFWRANDDKLIFAHAVNDYFKHFFCFHSFWGHNYRCICSNFSLDMQAWRPKSIDSISKWHYLWRWVDGRLWSINERKFNRILKKCSFNQY